MRFPPRTIDRSLISLPTELISTTNVQVLTAPDIRSASGSSGSSIRSGNESDFSTIDRSFLNNPGTDTSSIDSSPLTPVTPPMEDTKSFFDVKRPSTAALAILSPPGTPPGLEAPAVPQRSPSHSKKAHVELSRKRSIQHMPPPPTSLSRLAGGRNSADIFNMPADANHPFGQELAKVNEVAEEFGATARLLDEEEQEILSKGLCKFRVEDYLDEIAGLYGGIFEDQLGPMANPWI